MNARNEHPTPKRTWLRPLLVTGALLLAAAVFWRPLMGWFFGADKTASTSETAQAHEGTHAAPAPELVKALRSALAKYDSLRALLARDTLDGLAGTAAELASELESARSKPEVAQALAGLLEQAQAEARALGAASTLDDARGRFASLSQAFVQLLAHVPSLEEGTHVFSCPMVKGFNQWIQLSPKLENPYMGQKMLACGSPAPTAAATNPSPSSAALSQAAAYYTCPMHPAVKKDGPGTCPICGMDLTPVTQEEVSSGVIRVDETRAQQIGIKTAEVVEAPMDLSFRALGRVTYDETSIVDVTLKLDGYIQELRAATTGQPVKKGDVLFTLYSPELYAAQNEYLLARSSQSAANASLVQAARKRLELWGLTPGQIERIARKGEAQPNVAFLAPASGFLLEKNVVEGAAVKAGERLFRIAPLDKVWIEASVYEQELRRVTVGQTAEVSLPSLPGKTFPAKVAYVYPTLDEKTRTGTIRIELPNTGLELKPDMYAEVRFVARGEPRLQVPEEAILFTGPRRLVFVDLGEGRLRPQEVKLGAEGAGSYEVLEGLQAGDRVVTSGNFLVAAESRLRSASDTAGGSGHDAH